MENCSSRYVLVKEILEAEWLTDELAKPKGGMERAGGVVGPK